MNSKGFTLTEILVSSAVLGVVLAITLSFFVFYGRQSFNVSWAKRAEEAAQMAAAMIRRDVMESGYGVGSGTSDSAQPMLGLYVDDSGYTGPGADRLDRLYVNFSEHLHEQGGDSMLIEDNAVNAYTNINNVYNADKDELINQLGFMIEEPTLHYQGWLSANQLLGSDKFRLMCVPKDMNNYSVGAIIVKSGANVVRAVPLDFDGWPKEIDPPDSMPNTKTVEYRLGGPAGQFPQAGEKFVPAIMYSVEDEDLMRNGLRLLGEGQRIKFQSFEVNCRFFDGLAWQTSPTDFKWSDGAVPYSQLKTVVIEMKYVREDRAAGLQKSQTAGKKELTFVRKKPVTLRIEVGPRTVNLNDLS